MEVSMRKSICLLLMCVFLESTTSFGLAPSSSICGLDCKTFLYDLNSQCPLPNPLSSSPTQVYEESFERSTNSWQKNEYTAVLFYAYWCPFSRIFQSKFSALRYMYPQITHVWIEQSSVLPSVLSTHGIHSVPSLLIFNETVRIYYHGPKDLQSLISYYETATGMKPMVDYVEETQNKPESGPYAFQLWNLVTFQEMFSREPYLVLSAIFVILRVFWYIYPEIASRLSALWVAYIPHPNLGIFGESRQLVEHVLHLIDIKRIWTKLKNCKTRNFYKGARNARVWASSFASVSLGETS